MSEPLYKVGDKVLVQPHGMAFSPTATYHATITEVCDYEDHGSRAYHADVTFPHETVNGLIFEREIIGTQEEQ